MKRKRGVRRIAQEFSLSLNISITRFVSTSCYCWRISYVLLIFSPDRLVVCRCVLCGSWLIHSIYYPISLIYLDTHLPVYLSIYLSISSLTVNFTSFFTILIELHHPSLPNYPLFSHHVKRSYSTSHEETSAKSSAKLSGKAGWDGLGLDNETLKKNEN